MKSKSSIMLVTLLKQQSWLSGLAIGGIISIATSILACPAASAASGISGITALAFDASGNLFAADENKIDEFTPDGFVKTFAFAPSGSTATGLNNLALAISAADSISTAVLEPFTIIGTLIGGTAALRMRKKLGATAKE